MVGAEIDPTQQPFVFRLGLVVMVGYRRAVIGLHDELTALRPALRLVAAGDALAPRTLLDAVAEGARAGADV